MRLLLLWITRSFTRTSSGLSHPQLVFSQRPVAARTGAGFKALPSLYPARIMVARVFTAFAGRDKRESLYLKLNHWDYFYYNKTTIEII
jgi:hypothetical protein